MGFFACRNHRGAEDEDPEILLTLCDSSLTMSDVMRRIPAGMEREDSAEMFDAIVSSWIRGILLNEESGNLDPGIMEEIERKTASYRSHLIADACLRGTDAKGSQDIPEDSIRAYYDSHLKDFKLQRPLIKGIFLKIDAASPALEESRKFMAEGTPKAIEKLERYAGKDIIVMEVFDNRWTDISMAADLFPARPQGIEQLKAGDMTETTAGQTCSMLKITEMIPAGEIAPYDYARQRIYEIFRAGSRHRSERNLIKRLFDKARGAGRYSPGLYDLNQFMQKN